MKRQEIVTRLRGLREEIEQDGEVRIADLEVPFALALSDVCNALGLTSEEHDRVLGREAAAYVAEILRTRVWLVEMAVKEETATLTLAEVAAVPAQAAGYPVTPILS